MKNIVVIGSGFAGVWSALGARRLIHLHHRDDDIQVIVISPEQSLVLRPRLYEAGAAQMKEPLDELFRTAGVEFILGTVDTINSAENTVQVISITGEKAEISYDRLVLAAGSCIVRPEAVHGLEDDAFDIDTIHSAAKLEKYLQGLATVPQSARRDTVVVAGAGFTGLELACELPSRLRALLGDDSNPKVILVSNLKELAPELGDGPRPFIAQALEQAGVEVRLDSAVARVNVRGVTLASGELLHTMTPVWTGGVAASPLTKQIPCEKDPSGRLRVDQYLRVPSCFSIFATGDTACVRTGDQDGHYAMMSCQHALILGRVSGHNAAADLVGVPMKPYSQPGYLTCLDLGVYGAILAKGWDREVVLTGATGKHAKRYVNHVLISPPKGSLDEILAAADVPSFDPLPYLDRVPFLWTFAKMGSTLSNFLHYLLGF